MITRPALTRILVLVTTLALLAAACGGDEAPTAGEPGEAPAEMEEPPGEGGGLGALAEQWARTSAKVEYRMSGTGLESQGMILYWSPPDRWRMDFSGAQGETVMVSAGGASYFCSGGGGQSFCFESPGDASQQAPIPFAGLFTAPGALAEDIEAQTAGVGTEQSTETIAGEEASCFSVSAETAAAQAGAQWCFSSDGILLRYAAGSTTAEGTGEFTMEASSVERDVSDADFEPPYPVQEIPAPPGG